MIAVVPDTRLQFEARKKVQLYVKKGPREPIGAINRCLNPSLLLLSIRLAFCIR